MPMAQTIIIGLLLVLGVTVLLIVSPTSRKIAGGLVLNAVLGIGLLWAAGEIFGTSVRIGINGLTAGVCAVLGIPGWILLLLLKVFILK